MLGSFTVIVCGDIALRCSCYFVYSLFLHRVQSKEFKKKEFMFEIIRAKVSIF